jgi:hypothetical protein
MNWKRWLAGLFMVAVAGAARGPEVKPLREAHAHNDYEHQRPLLDALDHGFCSVEADIHLVEGKLLVAHSRLSVKPERTLQALYLDPLRARAKQNGRRVYHEGPEFTLLIDIKTDWHTTYPVLRDVLKEYPDIITVFEGGKKGTNAVSAIISGNRALEMFAGETTRYASYDGELTELESKEPADLIPWISADWRANFKWRGVDAFTDSEQQKLKEIVDKAHGQGRRVRFWGAPDQAVFWKAMKENGVDLINTDNLDGLRDFLADKH